MNNKDYKLNSYEQEQMRNRLDILLDDNPKNRSDIAKECGLSASGLSHFSKGNRQPNDMQIRKLADALGTTPEFILFGAAADDLFSSNPSLYQELLSVLSEAEEYYSHLNAAEKIYVFLSTYKMINIFRVRHPGGITFEEVRNLLNLPPVSGNPNPYY